MELADEDMEKVSGGGIPLWNKYVKAIRGRMANKPVQLKRKKACYNEEHNGNE